MERKLKKEHKVFRLHRSAIDSDIIYSRLSTALELLDEFEDDPFLEITQNKIIEALDWYERYCDEVGWSPYKG